MVDGSGLYEATYHWQTTFPKSNCRCAAQCGVRVDVSVSVSVSTSTSVWYARVLGGVCVNVRGCTQRRSEVHSHAVCTR
jgi:hypothetical protein